MLKRKNGYDHVTIDGYHGGIVGGAVSEEDVRKFFFGFEVDKVLRDHTGWYVTFKAADTARRAALVLSAGTRTLAQHSASVTLHKAPSAPSASTKRWSDKELVEQAGKMIMKELRAGLERDAVEKVVQVELKRMVLEEKEKRKGADGGQLQDQDANVAVDTRVIGLKGLSFRKQKKRVREEAAPIVEVPTVEDDVSALAMDVDVDEPLRKKPKKTSRKVVEEAEVESEDEAGSTPAPLPSPVSRSSDLPSRKRATSVSVHVEEPPAKKSKVVEESKLPPGSIKRKKHPKKHIELPSVEVVHQVVPDVHEIHSPAVAQLRLPSPTPNISVSDPVTPVPPVPPLPPKVPKPRPAPRSRAPGRPVDPFSSGLVEDDEDLFFVRQALGHELFGIDPFPPLLDQPSDLPGRPSTDGEPPARVHVTGSARTEGYYKISHTEKSAYVAQYAARSATNDVETTETPQPSNVASSRSNRANARRRAQGLEEHNQVQRAMALSKGESAVTDQIKFNQLQTRKKHLRFARSPIHDWGLYAMEKISRGEMVIEYVGEIIRAQVADKREKAYERQGIGSSYLFRIDEDLVVDATKKGNLGRLINHSCDPNCTAKIITINGEKKIVIYAKQDIELGSEITYDYHFPIEQDKIPCLCGSVKCRGYLN